MNEYAPGPHPSHPQAPGPVRTRRRMPGWAIALIVVGALAVLLVIITCAGLIYLGAKSPDTFVYSGNQVPAKYIDAARDRGLIDKNEQVLFFYSDAMLDVNDAMYILTDQNLALCNAEWGNPTKVIPFNEIVDVSVSWSGDWLTDSQVTVELKDGSYWSFPLSMENGTDRLFVDKLCESSGLNPVP